MIILRPLIVLAMLAALLGAPPSASAAASTLHSPEAAPTSGTTETSFRLRVGFLSRFPAGVVEAAVADRTVPMSLVAGSLLDGTWEGWAQLPAGQWPVTFTATALRGSRVSLAGPTLTVVEAAPRPSAMAPATAPDDPPPPSSPDRTTDGADGSDAPAPDGSAPAPAPAEDPGAEPAASDAAGTPNGDASPSAGTGPGDERTAGGSGSRAEPSPTPRSEPAVPSSPGGAASGGGNAGGADAAAPASSAPRASDGTLSMQQEPSQQPVAGGIQVEADAPADEASATAVDVTLAAHGLRVTAAWTAALLVVLAVLLGIVTHRRRRRDAARPDAAEAAAAAELILRRRALRRSRMVLPDDPIVASLGLDEDEQDTGRRPTRRMQRRDDAEPPA